MSTKDKERRDDSMSDLDAGWGEPSPSAPAVGKKPAVGVPAAPSSSTLAAAKVDAAWSDDDDDDDDDDLDALDSMWPEISEEEKQRGLPGLTATERRTLREQKAKKKAERRKERASLADQKQKKKKKRSPASRRPTPEPRAAAKRTEKPTQRSSSRDVERAAKQAIEDEDADDETLEERSDADGDEVVAAPKKAGPPWPLIGVAAAVILAIAVAAALMSR